jgi:hypothetical protein
MQSVKRDLLTRAIGPYRPQTPHPPLAGKLIIQTLKINIFSQQQARDATAQIF